MSAQGVSTISASDVRNVHVDLNSSPVVSTDVLRSTSKGTVKVLTRADGTRAKMFSKSSKGSAKLPSARKAPAQKAEGERIFEENFDAWNSSLMKDTWLPKGWSVACRDTQKHDEFIETDDAHYSWMVGDFMSDSPNMRVQNMVFGLDTYQDEWLVTPEFTPEEYYKFKFKLSYSPGWTRLDWETYEFTGINNILEVLVSDDKGENWKKIWDVTEHAKSFTEDELWDDCASMVHPFYQFVLPLDEYVGTPIQVAFRYVGQDGESMMVDDVEVSLPVVEASYAVPEGTFFWGFNEKLQRYNPEFAAVAPTNVKATWKNTSSVDVEESNWFTFNNAFSVVLESTDHDFTFEPKGFCDLYMPELTVSATGAEDGVYSVNDNTGFPVCTYFGGNMVSSYNDQYLAMEGPAVEMMLMGYNYWSKGLANIGFFGRSEEIDATVGGALGGTAENPMVIRSVGYMLPSSPQPYHFRKMMFVLGNFEADADAELKVEIFPMNNGYIDILPIATSTIKGSDVQAASGNLYSATFTFKGADLNGDPIDYIESQGNYYVRFDFSDERITSLEVTTQGVPNEDGACNSYFEVKNGEELMIFPVSALSISGVAFAADFSVNMDLCYSWIVADDDKFEVESDGGEKSFEVDAFHGHEDWRMYYMPEWLKHEFVAGEEGDSHKLVMKAEKNTSVEDRTATVYLASPGATHTIKVSQKGTSGVNAIVADEADGPVRYFNLNGVAVDGDNLTPGVYIRRQGAKATKVVVR